MKPQLTSNQLKHISKLITARGVSYVDVNKEFTDHIACEIEELLARKNITYRQALKTVFLRYTRFHFIKIEEAKEKWLRKQSWNEIKSELLQFFTIPKIAITILLFFCVRIIINTGNIDTFKYTLLTLSGMSFLVIKFFQYRWVGLKAFLQLRNFGLIWSVSFEVVFLILIRPYFDNWMYNIGSNWSSLIVTLIVLWFYVLNYLYAMHIIKMGKLYVSIR